MEEIVQIIESRRTDWLQLEELLNLSKGLSFHKSVAEEAAAIVSQRPSLIDEPNPTLPLVQQLVSKLREAVQFHFNAFRERHAFCTEQLNSDGHWQQLSPEQQQEILGKRSLLVIEEPSLGDTEALIDSLGSVSLELWSERTESLNSKFDSARLEAVELREPKLQRIVLPKMTFNDESSVDEWLDRVKQQIVDKLKDGPVTF